MTAIMKMKRFNSIFPGLILFVAAGLASVLVSCTKDTAAGSGEIRFNVSADWSESKSPATKASGLPSSTYFGWCGSYSPDGTFLGTESPKFYNLKMNYDGSYSNTAETCYWPSYGAVSFFAYYPWKDQSAASKSITLSGSSETGYPQITYLTPSDVASQEDFMTASSMNKFREGISLNFGHKMTKIDFQARLSADPGNLSIRMKSVELVDVSLKGTYSYGTDSWTLPTGSGIVSGNVIAFEAASAEEAVGLSNDAAHVKNLTSSAPLYLLPQSVGTGQTCKELNVEYMVDSTLFVRTIALPDATWAAGQHITYLLSVKPTDAELSLTFNVVDWTPVDVDRKLNFKCRTFTAVPAYTVLQPKHSANSSDVTLWSNVYQGGITGNTFAAGDFGKTIAGDTQLRHIVSIINVEKQTGGLYAAEKVFMLSYSSAADIALKLDYCNLSNYSEGDVLVFYNSGTSGSLYVYDSTASGQLVGPASAANASTTYKWITHAYSEDSNGYITSSGTNISTTTVSGHDYTKISARGYLILKRTAVNN